MIRHAIPLTLLSAVLLMPGITEGQLTYSMYAQSPHNGSYYWNEGFSFRCETCHTADGVTGSWAFDSNLYLCDKCHNNTKGAPYTLFAAPAMVSHSSTAMTNDPNGTLFRDCGSCHHGPTNNDWDHFGQIDQTNPLNTPALASGSYNGTITYDPASDTTTFPEAYLTVNDPDWNNPATWNSKTGPGRGLMLEITRAPDTAPRVWYREILEAYSNNDGTGSITIVMKGRLKSDVYTPFPPVDLRLFYGQEVLSTILTNTTAASSSDWTTSSVRFLRQQDAANSDGNGTAGGDSTPDGICQVCHTTTSYWRSDGSGTDHNNGLNCFSCHDHEKGFLPVNAPEDKSGVHSVHLDNIIYCRVCHYNAVDTFEVSSDPNYRFYPGNGDYSVNGSFEVDGWRYAWDGCNKWGVNATTDEFYCMEPVNPTRIGVSGCTTECHGSTQGGRYLENKVEANFSVRQIKHSTVNGTTTVAFDASRATCASLDANNTYIVQDCTYSWTFTGGITDGSTVNATEIVTFVDGDYNATLTMDMVGQTASDTQKASFTTPIETYSNTPPGRWQ